MKMKAGHLCADCIEKYTLMMMMMMMLMMVVMVTHSGQALISGDALQPTTYTGVPQYPGLGGFGTPFF